MSSVHRITLPKEALPFIVFFFFLLLLNYRQKGVKLLTYIQISSMHWFVGGFVEPPQQDLDGRALSRPKPHPSDKTE